MSRHPFVCRALWCAGLGTLLAAPRSAAAQAVQLPTFSQFSVGTTVSVPDRGRMHLGSVKRAREGSVSRGVPGLGGPLFGNRGAGREVSYSGLDVGVQIHDMAELDRQVLAAAASQSASRSVSPEELAEVRRALWLTQHMGRNPHAPPALGNRAPENRAPENRAVAGRSPAFPFPR